MKRAVVMAVFGWLATLFGCGREPVQAAIELRFVVEEVIYIKPPIDRVIVVGTVQQGAVHVGDSVWIETNGEAFEATVEGIESIQRGEIPKATIGQQVGLRLKGIGRDDVTQGIVIRSE